VLADDVCPVDLASPSGPRVWPSVARLKLWGDALSHLGLAADSANAVRRGIPKYSVFDAAGTNGHPGAARLTALYLLRASAVGRPERARTSGLDAIHVANRAIYRPQIGRLVGKPEALARMVMSLLANVPLFVIARDPNTDNPDSFTDRFLADLGR